MATVQTTRSSTTNPNGQNLGFGITGVHDVGRRQLGRPRRDASGRDERGSLPLRSPTARSSSRASRSTTSRSAGRPIGRPRRTSEGWTLTGGFRVTTGTEIQSFFNAYVLANREYTGYDESLKTGPYNFGFLNEPTRQDWVEHFPYQDGLLIDYWNTSVHGQQHERAPGRRADPAGRRPSDVAPLRERHADAAADPLVRLDLRARADRRDHACMRTACRRRSRRSRRSPVFDDRQQLLVCDRRPGALRTRTRGRRAGTASTCRRPARRFASRATRRAASCRSRCSGEVTTRSS